MASSKKIHKIRKKNRDSKLAANRAKKTKKAVAKKQRAGVLKLR